MRRHLMAVPVRSAIAFRSKRERRGGAGASPARLRRPDPSGGSRPGGQPRTAAAPPAAGSACAAAVSHLVHSISLRLETQLSTVRRPLSTYLPPRVTVRIHSYQAMQGSSSPFTRVLHRTAWVWDHGSRGSNSNDP